MIYQVIFRVNAENEAEALKKILMGYGYYEKAVPLDREDG